MPDANRTRARVWLNASAAAAGACDPGALSALEPCFEPCPVDCALGAWSGWSGCNATCGDAGYRNRTRPVTALSSHGGRCLAPLLDTAACHLGTCTPPVNCTLASWAPWDGCNATCGADRAARNRTRAVLTPAVHGGHCGAVFETGPCAPPPPPCPAPVNCTLAPVWSAWSTCSVPCEAGGGGSQNRTRAVAVPAAHGGAPCSPADARHVRGCGNESCSFAPAPLIAGAPAIVLRPGARWAMVNASGSGDAARVLAAFAAASGGAPPPLTFVWSLTSAPSGAAAGVTLVQVPGGPPGLANVSGLVLPGAYAVHVAVSNGYGGAAAAAVSLHAPAVATPPIAVPRAPAVACIAGRACGLRFGLVPGSAPLGPPPSGATLSLALVWNESYVGAISGPGPVPAPSATVAWQVPYSVTPAAGYQLEGTVRAGGQTLVSRGPPFEVKSPLEWYTGPWAPCSVGCGNGETSRDVLCIDAAANAPAAGGPAACGAAGLVAPDAITPCFAGPCGGAVTAWRVGGWGACTPRCGDGVVPGTAARTVGCVAGLSGVVIGDANCDAPVPSRSATCTPPACEAFAWALSGWGECSATCGAGGVQAREWVCTGSRGTARGDPSLCGGAGALAAAASSAASPPLVRPCDPPALPCGRFYAATGPFGACSAPCGGGVAARNVSCFDGARGDAPVPLYLCRGAGFHAPPSSRPCNTQACAGGAAAFVVGPWGACDARTCTRSRPVACGGGGGGDGGTHIPIGGGGCAGLAVPASAASCGAVSAGAGGGPENATAMARCAGRVCGLGGVDCSARGACVRGACVCAAGYSGAACEVDASCGGGRGGAFGASGACCASGVVSVVGACCGGAAPALDATGGCCGDAATLDACGVCGGNGTVVDAVGACCGALDAGGLCCGDGAAAVDACGVCGGVGACTMLLGLSAVYSPLPGDPSGGGLLAALADPLSDVRSGFDAGVTGRLRTVLGRPGAAVVVSRVTPSGARRGRALTGGALLLSVAASVASADGLAPNALPPGAVDAALGTIGGAGAGDGGALTLTGGALTGLQGGAWHCALRAGVRRGARVHPARRVTPRVQFVRTAGARRASGV